MILRAFCIAFSFGLFACQSISPPPSCAERATLQFEQGRRLLAESRDGEHYRAEPFEKAMATLHSAAKAGSRDAQSLYGRTLFATLYTNHAPEASKREAYVSALVALRRAGRGGDEAARRFLPGWSADPPIITDPPLENFPMTWISEAIEGSGTDTACTAR